MGCADIVGRIVEDLKDESEPYRRMVMETIDKVVHELGSSDLDARLEELLIDGILYAFQEQASDDANVMLNGFGTVVNSLKMRAKPYLPQICGTIKWRLNNKGAKIRQQAADLIARIAVVMKVRHFNSYTWPQCAIQIPSAWSMAVHGHKLATLNPDSEQPGLQCIVSYVQSCHMYKNCFIFSSYNSINSRERLQFCCTLTLAAVCRRLVMRRSC